MGLRRIASPWRLLGAVSLSLAAVALPARAELVVFADGRVVKAASHQTKGDQFEIRLPGGGSYSVDRSRIDQIVEDEVAHSDLPPSRPVETAPIIRAVPRQQAPSPAFVSSSAAQQAAEDRANKKEKDKSNRGGHGGGGHSGGGNRRSKAGGGG